MSELPKVLCILGLTGVGKSSLAISLAREVSLEVVNCDSRQVYRDFPIITAQPGAEEQRNVPHRLYGFMSSKERISAGRFSDLAQKAIAEIRQKGRLPVLVGGTGLYFRSVLQGLAPIPAVPEEIRHSVQAMAEEKGLSALYDYLQEVDPLSAGRLHPNDRQRITRALEVFLFTGKPISYWQKECSQASPRYNALKIGLRDEWPKVVANLECRIEQMLAQGALEEARRAWERCPDPAAPAWSGIGCAELLGCLQGRFSLREAVELWKRNTRKYAKRQLTWFKREEDVHWFAPGDLVRAVCLVKDFLSCVPSG